MKGNNPGWKQLQDFRDTWDETLAGMEKEPAEDILEALFKQKIRFCDCLSHDISIYDRAEKGSTERSYQFLYDAVNRFLSRKLSEVNRADVQRNIKRGLRDDPNSNKGHDRRGRSRDRPALAAENGKPKRKPSGGNSRGRSAGTKGGGKGNRKTSRSASPKGGKDRHKGVCYSWKNHGKCDKKDQGKCPYSHDDKDRSSSPSRSPSPGGKGNRRTSRGRGEYSKTKRERTPIAERKNKSCYFYLRNKCQRGDKCDFKHDPDELEKFRSKRKDFQ